MLRLVLEMCRPALAAFCLDILRNEGPSAFYKGYAADGMHDPTDAAQ